MKKAIFSVAIAIASMVGFAATAQTPEAATGATQQVEQCGNDAKCDKAHKKHDIKKGDLAGERHHGKGMKSNRSQRHGEFNPFEGLNLTPEQQTALEALRPQKGQCPGDKAQCSEAKPDCKDKAQCDKKDCKKADKAKCDKKDGKKCDKKEGVSREDRAADMKARRAEYLGKVKEILTPEQYVQFLENNFSPRR